MKINFKNRKKKRIVKQNVHSFYSTKKDIEKILFIFLQSFAKDSERFSEKKKKNSNFWRMFPSVLFSIIFFLIEAS